MNMPSIDIGDWEFTVTGNGDLFFQHYDREQDHSFFEFSSYSSNQEFWFSIDLPSDSFIYWNCNCNNSNKLCFDISIAGYELISFNKQL